MIVVSLPMDMVVAGKLLVGMGVQGVPCLVDMEMAVAVGMGMGVGVASVAVGMGMDMAVEMGVLERHRIPGDERRGQHHDEKRHIKGEAGALPQKRHAEGHA